MDELRPTVRFLTLYDVLERLVGVRELAGAEEDHPLIVWALESVFEGDYAMHDETPWCSAVLNRVAWLLRLPRSKSALARSWLDVGAVVPSLDEAIPRGNDVVVLWRGKKNGWQGHVGLYAGHDSTRVWLLGGNQSDAVTVAAYPRSRLLGIRRLM